MKTTRLLVAFACLLIAYFLTSCGSLEEASKKELGALAGSEPVAGNLPGNTGADKGAAQGESSEMCLTDCDNARWKDIVLERLTIEQPAQFASCSIDRAIATPRDPNIEVTAAVNCANLRSLYVWSINAAGSVVSTPVLQGSCPLGQSIQNLRRSLGTNAALSAWSCEDSNWSYGRVRVEDLSGKQLAFKSFSNSHLSTWRSLEVAYNSKSDLWGVAVTGSFWRFNSTGLLGGATTWSLSSYWFNTQSLTVRDGVFQLMEGSGKSTPTQCSRVSSGGTLLCKSNTFTAATDSVVPVSGSRHILVQEDERISLGIDSENSCGSLGTGQTISRHKQHHKLIQALQITGTSYIAALTEVDSDIAVNLYQMSPSIEHASTLPVADYGDYTFSTVNMFESGSAVYVSTFGSGELKIMRLSKIQLP